MVIALGQTTKRSVTTFGQCLSLPKQYSKMTYADYKGVLTYTATLRGPRGHIVAFKIFMFSLLPALFECYFHRYALFGE